MLLTVIRVVVYFVAPLAAMLPGVAYDGGNVITVNLETATTGLAVAATAVSVIFAKWGKK